MSEHLTVIAKRKVTLDCWIVEEYYSYEGLDKIAERELRKYLKQIYPFVMVKYNANNNITNIIVKRSKSLTNNEINVKLVER